MLKILEAIEFHIETIKCPECGTIQEAEVKHTLPWPLYAHICSNCLYGITESEWEEVKSV